MSNIVPARNPALPSTLGDQVEAFCIASKSKSTLRAYDAAWRRIFVAWCQRHGVVPLPATPAVVAAFLADQAASKKVSTIVKYLSAINEAHRLAEHEPPSKSREVQTVLKGIKRTLGTAQKGKAPLLVRHLRAIMKTLPSNLIGARDRALLLLGFAGALRRSELVALNVDDLEFRDEGLVVNLRWSKTDQEGQGRLVGIPYGSFPATCPVRAMKRWLEMSEITDGPIFRSVSRHGHLGEVRLSRKAVALAVKRAVKSIGLDPEEYSGHSLRAGLATEAAGQGVGELAIMRQTGHKSITTLRGYIRPATLWINNAAASVGL